MRSVLATALLLLLTGPPAARATGVPFFVDADTSFDRFTDAPTPDQQAWMRAHYWRLLAYSPYFDSRLAWFPNAWAYEDLYAIYLGSSEAAANPDWILHDAAGNPLYIPYACRGGTCPQYAADVGNASFRSQWISDATTTLAAGYRGLFIDDVNLTLDQVSDGTGTPVVPQDPRTGQPMTETDWRRYLADFTVQIRDAFPNVELVHNALWFVGDADPSVEREIAAADCINIERGVNDRGIQPGDGPFGFDTFLAHVDFVHRVGRPVLLEGFARTRSQREYGLAAHFLLDGGSDALGNPSGGTPNHWWSAYDVSLGAPAGPRYAWSGVLRRDFEAGMVLVNPPGAPRQRIILDIPCRNLQGRFRRSVSLHAAGGAVLRCP